MPSTVPNNIFMIFDFLRSKILPFSDCFHASHILFIGFKVGNAGRNCMIDTLETESKSSTK